MNRRTIVFLALATLVITGCGSGDKVAVAPGETPAPASTGMTMDQVKSSSPAVLYFVKTDCGSNSEAVPLVQALYEANKDSGKFYVVMNADEDEAAKWSQDHKTTFPIISDPNREIIKKYGVQFSQTGIWVDSDLKEVKRFPGYGKKTLEDINKTIAGKGAPAKVDLSAAPESGLG